MTSVASIRAAASTPAAAMLASSRALVCGILNVTPDSFYDGGRYTDQAPAVGHGRRIAAEGADLIDVGGESTRPGARPPTVEEELARVVPVIESLSQSVAVPLSVDTSRPEVMREAAWAGATMINDVRALRLPGALAAAAELDLPVCLMHMRGEPDRMQHNPVYNDVVADVQQFLAERLRACERVGMDRAARGGPRLRVRQEPRSQSAAPQGAARTGGTRRPHHGRAVPQGSDRRGHRPFRGGAIDRCGAARRERLPRPRRRRHHMLAVLAAVEHHGEPPP